MNLSVPDMPLSDELKARAVVPSTVASALANRWSRARRAALLNDASDELDVPEVELIERAWSQDRDLCLRRVFDNSRRLGLGFRKFYRVDVPLYNLIALLPQSGVSCLHGTWSKVEPRGYFQMERPPCEWRHQCQMVGAFFREATDGLVLGLSSSAHFARHRCYAAKDETCVDVLFTQGDQKLRFGPIPDLMRPGLDDAKRVSNLFDSGTEIEFLGVSEGVLFYSTKSSSASPGVRIAPTLERAIARRFPLLRLRDVTPREVPIENSKDIE